MSLNLWAYKVLRNSPCLQILNHIWVTNYMPLNANTPGRVLKLQNRIMKIPISLTQKKIIHIFSTDVWHSKSFFATSTNVNLPLIETKFDHPRIFIQAASQKKFINRSLSRNTKIPHPPDNQMTGDNKFLLTNLKPILITTRPVSWP